MVKSISYIDKTIFDYLGEEDYAAFLCETGMCDGIRLNDGVLWVQYNERNELTAIIVSGESGKRLVFPRENANFEELAFFGSIKCTDKNQIDKKYLLRICKKSNEIKNGCEKDRFARIKGVEGVDLSTYADIVSLKMLLKDMGKCKGILISENGEDVGGAFIQHSQNISIITDVYVKEQHRGNGYGKEIVKNLLLCSETKTIYLVSRQHNVKFYENCGFETVKEIREMYNVF